MGVVKQILARAFAYRAYALQFMVELSKNKKTKMPAPQNHVLDGSEKSMIHIIKSGMGVLPFAKSKKNNALVALEEFSVGTGISDLTIFSVDKALLKQRKQNSALPLTEKVYVDILMYITSARAVKSADLVEHFTPNYSRSLVERSVERLVGRCVLSKSGDTYRPCLDIQTNSTQNIIAIEAKVKDWRSGLRQAIRYQEYADYSYLAVYEKHITKCIENKAIFDALGIGLIGVSDQGISLHWSAKPSNLLSYENKILAFERFLSFTDDRYEPFVVRNNFVTHNPTRVTL